MAEINNPANLGIEFTYFNIPGIIICLLGVASNVSLLVAFIKDPLKCFRSSGTYLVMNLTVSDCLICLLCLPHHITPIISNSRVIFFFVHWIGGVSIVSITSISIDRFLMVNCPIKHRILMKDKVMILWITAIWLVTCVISASTTFSNIGETNNSYVAYLFSVIVIILSSVMYSSTYHKLKKQSRNVALQNATEGRAQQIRILKEKRFLKTIFIIACMAIVCTLPFLLVYLLSFLLDSLRAFAISYAVCLYIFHANFAVNPIIYILRLPNYRRTFQLLFCRRITANSS